jgi:hypothetical protein
MPRPAPLTVICLSILTLDNSTTTCRNRTKKKEKDIQTALLEMADISHREFIVHVPKIVKANDSIRM